MTDISKLSYEEINELIEKDEISIMQLERRWRDYEKEKGWNTYAYFKTKEEAEEYTKFEKEYLFNALKTDYQKYNSLQAYKVLHPDFNRETKEKKDVETLKEENEIFEAVPRMREDNDYVREQVLREVKEKHNYKEDDFYLLSININAQEEKAYAQFISDSTGTVDLEILLPKSDAEEDEKDG